MRHIILGATLLLVSIGGDARARDHERRIEIGGHLAMTDQNQLDTTDLGFGGRFGAQVSSLFGIEGEVSFYPSDVPDGVPVTRSRLEGLFGVKVGPRLDRFSVFGKVRPGFVRFGSAPEPVACIAIFPPPLNCILAGGETVLALDLGGGIELYPTERVVLRVDVSSLLLDYPGPAFARGREAFGEGGSWKGNLRLTFGAGLTF